jgi:hypothetical protein
MWRSVLLERLQQQTKQGNTTLKYASTGPFALLFEFHIHLRVILKDEHVIKLYLEYGGGGGGANKIRKNTQNAGQNNKETGNKAFQTVG